MQLGMIKDVIIADIASDQTGDRIMRTNVKLPLNEDERRSLAIDAQFVRSGSDHIRLGEAVGCDSTLWGVL